MDTTGTMDQVGTTGEATGQETAAGSATEQVASEGSQGQEANAGGEQSFSESGKDNGTGQRRSSFKSPQQRLYELRQQSREREQYWESELGSMKEKLSRFEQMFGQGQKQKPSRTFYEAPEDTLRELLKESLEPFRENLLGEIRQTQEERDSRAAVRQEASEAAKFIRSQKNMTPEDVQEIRELLATDEVAQSLSENPMKQAKYLLFLWKEQRGIGDRSGLKDMARGVTGASVSTGGAQKTWTESEMAKEMEKLGPVHTWGPEQKKKRQEFEREFMKAYAEGRVKK